MTLRLFGHPFSSYTWKALIPLYENDTPFELRNVDPAEPGNAAELARRWPVAKFPILVDGGTQIVEATAIVEYLDAVHPGATRFLPADARAAVEVRMLDRIFDNHVMNVMQVYVEDAMRPPERKDPVAVTQAGAKLDTIYAWLAARMANREWAAADAFTLADCAAAPALFYADWVHPIPDGALRDYRARLLARPSIARAIDGGRPYRHYFPLGAPDRD